MMKWPSGEYSVGDRGIVNVLGRNRDGMMTSEKLCKWFVSVVEVSGHLPHCDLENLEGGSGRCIISRKIC